MDREAIAEKDDPKQVAMLIVDSASGVARERSVPAPIFAETLASAAAVILVGQQGRETAERRFRELADQIAAGAFDLTGGDSTRRH